MAVAVPVSVVIPVRNEEKRLRACLERLGRFAEVVVVDSDSSDKTQQIARESGAVVLNFDWSGRFPKKRNWTLRNHSFRAEWVLFLDADELVTTAFVDELEETLPATRAVAFWIRYTNHFMGRKLNYGVAQRKLALIKRGFGEYERIDESRWSSFDMEIHEHLRPIGQVGEMREKIDHVEDDNIEKYIRKHNEYSSWEANRFMSLSSISSEMTMRQRLKYRLVEYSWYGRLYFIYEYFVKLGLLDGSAGYVHARLKAYYFFCIYLKIAELRRNSLSDFPPSLSP